MNESQISSTGAFIRPSIITFSDGTSKKGMISIFFPDEQDQFYLVLKQNLVQFSKLIIESNYEEMRKLCEKVDLMDVINVQKI